MGLQGELINHYREDDFEGHPALSKVKEKSNMVNILKCQNNIPDDL